MQDYPVPDDPTSTSLGEQDMVAKSYQQLSDMISLWFFKKNFNYNTISSEGCNYITRILWQGHVITEAESSHASVGDISYAINPTPQSLRVTEGMLGVIHSNR